MNFATAMVLLWKKSVKHLVALLWLDDHLCYGASMLGMAADKAEPLELMQAICTKYCRRADTLAGNVLVRKLMPLEIANARES